MIWIFAIPLIFVIALFVVDHQIAAPKYTAGSSNHFDGKKFINPDDFGTHHYFDVLKWWFSGNDKGEWHEVSPQEPSGQPDVITLGRREELTITFVNHSTFLIQFDGLNIITDPIWSYRASPYQWIGPKRMRSPGISFENLPPIDIVLISHNHYDHLDIASVKRLCHDHNPEFVVPLGVDKYLKENGITEITALDWWKQHTTKAGLELDTVPARHFSGRGLFDRNATLWCGFVLHSSFGNIYYAGDTGYGNFFKEIGRKFGPMYASFIPIGAYKPEWFMESIHISPEQAVQVHKDVASAQSFAMHFGTFPMADDGMYDPQNDLKKALGQASINEKNFQILKEGMPVQVSARAGKDSSY